MTDSMYSFRFHIKEDAEWKVVEIAAPHGTAALNRLFDEHPQMTSWDFAQWSDGSYKRLVAA